MKILLIKISVVLLFIILSIPIPINAQISDTTNVGQEERNYVDSVLTIWFNDSVINDTFLCDYWEQYEKMQKDVGNKDSLEDTGVTGCYYVNNKIITDPVLLESLHSFDAVSMCQYTDFSPCKDTLSFTRYGDTIRTPAFWNCYTVRFNRKDIVIIQKYLHQQFVGSEIDFVELVAKVFNDSTGSDTIPKIGNDTNFVTPDELEPGWGFYWRSPETQEIEVGPKSYLWSLAVSPDGKYLAYRDWDALKVVDIETKEIFVVDSHGIEGIWSKDSKILRYIPSPYMERGSYFWFPSLKAKDTLCYLSTDRCVVGSDISMALDNKINYIYFVYPHSYPPKDSLVYRTDLDSSLKVGSPIYELIEGLKWEMQEPPIFPPFSIDYNIRIKTREWFFDVTGFDIVTGFDYKGRRTYSYPFDSTWEINGINTFQQDHSPNVVLGPNADVYAYLTFRSKTEIANHHNPPFDSAAIAARNACGWYRVDTSGTNLVHLVRSWTYNVGGLSITGDGETIYYGIILNDSCAGIMKMNKYGKNKELVLRIPPIVLTDIDGVNIKKKEINLRCFPNISYDYLNIYYDCDIEPEELIFQIYNINGNLLLTKEIKNLLVMDGFLKMDISNLCNGIYFIIAKDRQSVGFDKFSIIR